MTEMFKERNDANLLSFKDCHLNNLLSKRSTKKKQQGEVGKVTLVNTGVRQLQPE